MTMLKRLFLGLIAMTMVINSVSYAGAVVQYPVWWNGNSTDTATNWIPPEADTVVESCHGDTAIWCIEPDPEDVAPAVIECAAASGTLVLVGVGTAAAMCCVLWASDTKNEVVQQHYQTGANPVGSGYFCGKALP